MEDFQKIKDFEKDFEKFSYKLLCWIKLNLWGIIIIIIIVILNVFILIVGNNIPNLEKSILVTSILTPYFIIYLTTIKEKKRKKIRLLAIYRKISFFLFYLYNNAKLIGNVQKSIKNKDSMKTLPQEDIKELSEFMNKVTTLISEFNRFTINDLHDLSCVILDPDNSFIFIGDYSISAQGIRKLNADDHVIPDEAIILKILKELRKEIE